MYGHEYCDSMSAGSTNGKVYTTYSTKAANSRKKKQQKKRSNEMKYVSSHRWNRPPAQPRREPEQLQKLYRTRRDECCSDRVALGYRLIFIYEWFVHVSAWGWCVYAVCAATENTLLHVFTSLAGSSNLQVKEMNGPRVGMRTVRHVARNMVFELVDWFANNDIECVSRIFVRYTI